MPHNQTQSPKPNPPSPQKRCWDWLLTPGNMHYAINRSSFRTYKRAPTKISGRRVLGVGTVELKVRRAPDDDRPNTLVLNDVLHIPGERCNGLCVERVRREGGVVVDLDEGGCSCSCRVWRGGREEALWYGEEYCGGSRVALWGDPRGVSYLGGDGDGGGFGVDASEEELETLFSRVRERSLV